MLTTLLKQRIKLYSNNTEFPILNTNHIISFVDASMLITTTDFIFFCYTILYQYCYPPAQVFLVTKVNASLHAYVEYIL